MNPSTEDMLNAIKKVNADHIFILPNNKNIIMAANQARDLTEDKEIIVIPSKTVPQGITALVNFIPDLTPEENLENMTAEMERVQTARLPMRCEIPPSTEWKSMRRYYGNRRSWDAGSGHICFRSSEGGS